MECPWPQTGSCETCFSLICPRLRKYTLIYVLPSCFFVSEEGEGEEQKWIQIQTWTPSWSKFSVTSEKRCQSLEIQIRMHSNFSWNRRRGIDLTQLVWFHHLSPTHSWGFFSGERSVWTCMAGCKQLDIYVYPLCTPAQPQEKRCFHAPFSVLVLSSLSWGELVKELGNEYPDLFPWASHILKEAPNYIWR